MAKPDKGSRARTRMMYLLIALFVLLYAGQEAWRTYSRSQKVTAADFGEQWPFSVSEGYVRCDAQGVVFYAKADEYNLSAAAENPEPLAKIWKDAPGAPAPNATKMSLAPVIEVGLKLCE